MTYSDFLAQFTKGARLAATFHALHPGLVGQVFTIDKVQQKSVRAVVPGDPKPFWIIVPLKRHVEIGDDGSYTLLVDGAPRASYRFLPRVASEAAGPPTDDNSTDRYYLAPATSGDLRRDAYFAPAGFRIDEEGGEVLVQGWSIAETGYIDLMRIELDGYDQVTREVAVAADPELFALLARYDAGDDSVTMEAKEYTARRAVPIDGAARR